MLEKRKAEDFLAAARLDTIKNIVEKATERAIKWSLSM